MDDYLDKDVKEKVTIEDEESKNLSEALTCTFLPNLQACSSSLKEVLLNQDSLIKDLSTENEKLLKNYEELDFVTLISQAKLYQSKLESIKKEMKILHNRSAKLKKRSIYLEQVVTKESERRLTQKQKELEKEQSLIAKPAKRSN